ncbi:DUF7507 domain-containing protein [Clostridium sp. B9]|uniref:DUF7507 domain-containing protein n=1 Tax=Clostridium sp. B9 TaxID=3423224 RepID=UPI003D2F0CEC
MTIINRFATTQRGAMLITGNTLGLSINNADAGAFITLDTSQQVAGFPAGSTLLWQNNSSSAQVNIPAGSTVLYAELQWGGTSIDSNGDNVTAFLNNSITFTTPLGNNTISPDPATAQEANAGAVQFYSRSQDVTSLIQAAGNGTYTVAGVPASINGGNSSVGWSLGIIYGNPTFSIQNMSIYSGIEGITAGSPPVDFTVSGFLAPSSGPVSARILVSAMEGDLGNAGDQMLFGPNTASLVNLSGPNNPSNNFFKSAINDGSSVSPTVGQVDTSGTFGTLNLPALPARYGWDITNVQSTNFVNNQTSAVVRITTVGDGYAAGFFGVQLDAVEIDYGDAPDTNSATQSPGNYRTTLASDGPRHGIGNSLRLGSQITGEDDAYQNRTADGDDQAKGIQDDGTTFPLTPLGYNDNTYSLDVVVNNNLGEDANLYAWLDFNQDGIFQSNEGVELIVPSNPAPQTVTLNFNRPANSYRPIGNTYVRVRVTTEDLVNSGISTAEDTRSFGLANDGEVEDYFLPITNVPFTCGPIAYRVATVGTQNQLTEVNLITGDITVVNPNFGAAINSIGYNTLDNLIYGTLNSDHSIVVLDANGNLGVIGQVPNLPNNGFNTGAFDDAGHLYIYQRNQARFYVVDLDQTSPTYMQLVDPTAGFVLDTAPYGTAVSAPLDISDWAFSLVDGNLYGVAASGTIQCLDPTTGNVVNLVTSGVPAGIYGSIYSYANGELYVTRNSDGNIYRVDINPPNATGEFFSQEIASGNNDGASCVNADILIDFGDAPDTGAGNGPGNYSTLLANNGPRHGIVNNLTIGTQVTAEDDAYQNATATGDDISQGIQDDGPTFPLTNMALNATSYTLPIDVVNDTGEIANLYAWIDFNKDGIFQTDEGFITTVPSSPATQNINLNFNVPAGTILTPGQTFVRVRLTTDDLINTGGVTEEDTRSLGAASDGEVEDYELIIEDTRLNIAKSVDENFSDIDDVLTYTVTITNPGTLPIDDVFFQDSIPPGTVYNNNLFVDTAFTGLDPQTGLTITTINPGQTVTISWEVQVDNAIPAPNPILNTGEVTIPGLPTEETNTVQTQVNFVELTPVKYVDKNFADVGDELTYTITFTPEGNVDAENVVITDTIPNDTTYVPGSINSNVAFTGDPTSQINLINPVAPGETVTVTFRVSVDAVPIPNPIPNTATVDYEYVVDPADPLVSVNIDSNTVTTQINHAELNPLKSVSDVFADVGDVITYTITFTNTGNVDAENVFIVDPIPNDTTYVPASISVNVPFTGDPTTQIDLTNPVAPGETVTITFDVTIDRIPNPNPIPNTATVNYEHIVDPADPPNVESKDTNTVTTLVNHGELVATKAVDKEFAQVGEEVVYTITFTNIGNVAVDNVIVTDSIPNGTSYVPGSISSNVAFTGNPTSQINIINSIAPAETVVISYSVLINEIPNPNPIPNKATIDYEYIVDPTEPPVTATIDTNTVTTQVNSAIINPIKAVNKEFAEVGDEITYTISFTNTGNVDAENIIVTDPIPNGTSYVPGSISSNVAFTGNPTSQINITSPLGPGETVTIIFNVLIDEIPNPNPIPNKATVDYEYVVDPAETPVTATIDTNTVTTLVNFSELNPIKSVDKEYAKVGDEISYTISFINTGNVDAENIIVTDSVPNGTSYVAGSITSNVAFTGDPTSQINITNSLAPGENVIITFRVLIEEIPSPNPIPNTATINYEYVVDPAEPLVPGSEITNTVTTEVREALINPLKSVDKEYADIGDEITYTITFTNTGNVDLENVEVVDPIPNDTTYVSGSITANVSFTGNPTTSVHLTNTVSVGETVVIVFKVIVDNIPNPNPIPNTATINYSYELVPGEPLVDESIDTNTVYTEVRNADLGPVEKSADKDFVQVGDTINYSITFTNTGNVAAENVSIVDGLRNGTTLVPGTLFVNVPYTGDLNTGLLLTNPVEPGETIVINYTLLVNEVPNPNPIENTAKVTYEYTVDPNKPPKEKEIDSNTVDVFVNPVEIIKTCSPKEVALGGVITYNFTIINSSEVEITNVIFFDKLPSGVEFIEGSFKGAISNNVIASDLISGVPLGDINSKELKLISFKVRVNNVPCPAEFPNVASLDYRAEFTTGEISNITSLSNECTVDLKKLGFKQEFISDVLEIPVEKPDIERILSFEVNVVFDGYEIIESPVGIALSKKNLTGKKVVVNYKICAKVVYVANNDEQSVHSAHYEISICNYIVLPTNIELNCVLNFYYVEEDIYYNKLNERKFFYAITYLIESGV